MKMSELRDMTKDELLEKLETLRGTLFNLRFQHATKQLENTAQLLTTRKDIARVLTALGELDRKISG